MDPPVPPSTAFEYDFARYVAERKGEAAARLREGAAYAYGGDLKVRAALDRVRPVTLALEAGVRFWHSVGKNRVLGNAVRVGAKQFPEIAELLASCAGTLQIEPPALYVSPALQPLEAETLGTSDKEAIELGSGLGTSLSRDEMLAVIGHACGHIQNNHVPYLTALYVLDKASNLVLRWAAQPAVLGLRGWARRAEITCDRASLLCARKLDATISAMLKRALGPAFVASVDLEQYLAQLDEAPDGRGQWTEAFAAHPALPRRIKALRLFAGTTYFRSVLGEGAAEAGSGGAGPGISKEECDAQVAELLAVLG